MKVSISEYEREDIIQPEITEISDDEIRRTCSDLENTVFDQLEQKKTWEKQHKAEEIRNRELIDRIIEILNSSTNQKLESQKNSLTFLSHFAAVNINRRKQLLTNVKQRIMNSLGDEKFAEAIFDDNVERSRERDEAKENNAYRFPNPEDLIENLLPMVSHPTRIVKERERNNSFRSRSLAISRTVSGPESHGGHQRRNLILKLLNGSQSIYDRQNKNDESTVMKNFGFHDKQQNVFDTLEDEGIAFKKDTKESNGNSAGQKLTLDNITKITLPKLVELVTSRAVSNVKFLNTLLVTHHSFCDSSRLLELLIERFLSVKPPPNLTKAEQDYFNEKTGSAYKMKVANCIKKWLEKHWDDDWRANEVLQKNLEKFLNEVKIYSDKNDSETPKADAKLVKMLEAKLNRMRNQSDERRSTLSVVHERKCTSSVEFGPNLDLVSMAAALTEKFNEVFVQIRPREFLKQAWKSKNKTVRAPNVLEMIMLYNCVTGFTCMEILKKENLQERICTMKLFIILMDHLACPDKGKDTDVKKRYFNNIYGAKAIYDALSSSSIYRLEQTWAGLSKRPLETWAKWKELFGGRPRILKEHMKAIRAQQCIPPLMLMMDDFYKIEERLKDKSCDNMINFHKTRILEREINNLNLFRNKNINWKLILDDDDTQVYAYLTDALKGELWSEKKMHQISKQLEPNVTN